ncbi:hypothetical protein ACKVWM_011653 [Pyricularia oryzae]
MVELKKLDCGYHTAGQDAASVFSPEQPPHDWDSQPPAPGTLERSDHSLGQHTVSCQPSIESDYDIKRLAPAEPVLEIIEDLVPKVTEEVLLDMPASSKKKKKKPATVNEEFLVKMDPIP